jgi:hypothetical protein
MFRTSQVHPQESLVQAVCADLVCGDTRTTRYTMSSRYGVVGKTTSSTCFGPHRSILRSVLYKLYVQIWYVVIRVLLDIQCPAVMVL